jgi:uncharacterized protein YbaR (Trm112 family)
LIDPLLLTILRCPQDHSELAIADALLVGRVNEHIKSGNVLTVAGQPMTKAIDGGLVRAAGDRMYPIIGGIPVMLADEALDIAHLRGTNGAP